MYNSQIELEQEMQIAGQTRARNVIEKNEKNGRAAHNVYARPIFNRFVGPLAERITQDLATPNAGKRKAHLVLLRGLEPEVVAFIAVRSIIVMLMQDVEFGNARKMAHSIGRNIQSEQVIKQLDHADPERYYYLCKELDRRASQSVEKRLEHVKYRLAQNHISPIDWGHGARLQVGYYCVEVLKELGLVEYYQRKVKKSKRIFNELTVSLSPDVLEIIEKAGCLYEETTPFMLPCVEKPLHWTTVFEGGFHSPFMQMAAQGCVLGGDPAKSDVKNLLGAINAMQDVSWSINTKVLEVAKKCVSQGDMDEIVGPDEKIRPLRPDWLSNELTKEDMSDSQKAMFKQWKKDSAEWYTQKKLRIQRKTRMMMSFNVASKFADEKEMFFVYQADFRGRFYPRTLGVNPQGSDLQKALIQFAEGKPLKTKEAEMWFLVHGANKSGNDKMTLEDRVKWVEQNSQLILAVADDPVNNTWWKDVDCPFQFLAWCFEYAEYKRYGKGLLQSKIPISMDGSCNGLQNFSAAFRDKVGAKATNLSSSKVPQDIYQQVANVCLADVQAAEVDKEGFRAAWLKHGIKRSLVKRSVMTMPYGSTMFSCRDFIIKDYMNVVLPPEFCKTTYPDAAGWLAKILWGSIAKVVLKAREAMQWLQQCSAVIIKKEKDIRWTTPSGFVVVQDYRRLNKLGMLRVQLYGGCKVQMAGRGKEPNPYEHRNGIAPNFVHSLDAAHMQRVVLRCRQEGIQHFAMIHDDFGTHAADAEFFNSLIRQEFVAMYEEQDWMQNFWQDYTDKGYKLPLPPEKGDFDIQEVLSSRYFFA